MGRCSEYDASLLRRGPYHMDRKNFVIRTGTSASFGLDRWRYREGLACLVRVANLGPKNVGSRTTSVVLSRYRVLSA